MAANKVFVLEGEEDEDKSKLTHALVQWYEEGVNGKGGLFSKIKCNEIFTVPNGAIDAGVTEFLYNKKKKPTPADVDKMRDPSQFMLGKWKDSLYLCKVQLISDNQKEISSELKKRENEINRTLGQNILSNSKSKTTNSINVKDNKLQPQQEAGSGKTRKISSKISKNLQYDKENVAVPAKNKNPIKVPKKRKASAEADMNVKLAKEVHNSVIKQIVLDPMDSFDLMESDAEQQQDEDEDQILDKTEERINIEQSPPFNNTTVNRKEASGKQVNVNETPVRQSVSSAFDKWSPGEYSHQYQFPTNYSLFPQNFNPNNIDQNMPYYAQNVPNTMYGHPKSHPSYASNNGTSYTTSGLQPVQGFQFGYVQQETDVRHLPAHHSLTSTSANNQTKFSENRCFQTSDISGEAGTSESTGQNKRYHDMDIDISETDPTTSVISETEPTCSVTETLNKALATIDTFDIEDSDLIQQSSKESWNSSSRIKALEETLAKEISHRKTTNKLLIELVTAVDKVYEELTELKCNGHEQHERDLEDKEEDSETEKGEDPLNGKTKECLKKICKDSRDYKQATRQLANELFTKKELATCSVMGLATRKGTGEKRPGLPRTRRETLFKLILRSFKVTTSRLIHIALNDYMRKSVRNKNQESETEENAEVNIL